MSHFFLADPSPFQPPLAATLPPQDCQATLFRLVCSDFLEFLPISFSISGDPLFIRDFRHLLSQVTTFRPQSRFCGDRAISAKLCLNRRRFCLSPGEIFVLIGEALWASQRKFVADLVPLWAEIGVDFAGINFGALCLNRRSALKFDSTFRLSKIFSALS